MRILYIHQFFATRDTALGPIRSYEFARRMVEEGHEVTMITGSTGLPERFSARLLTTETVDGIDVRCIRVPYSNYMGYVRRILSFLQFTLGATWLALTAGRHDVVFATSTPLTVGIPGWLAAALRRTPFVFEVRDLWPEAPFQMGALKRTGLMGRTAKALERFLYRRARHVVALSPGMAEGVLAEGIPAERVHMIPNSADLDLFTPGPKDADMVSAFELGDRFVVGYAGAIGPSNAVEDQVPEAARLLAERGRDDIVFLIAGDGKSVPTLAERTAGLPNVRLVGSMAKRDVPRFTRTADMLMTLFADRPILATNSPNKFFDALASGRPVLVNSAGWTKDLVEDNECGVYVPFGDGAATADAITRVADDRDLAARMGANARKLAEERFARDDLAHQLIEVLQRAVAG